MIRMLSRFDLKPGIDLKTFEQHYYDFVERAKKINIAISTDKIGRRISDTPMDTDAEDAQEFYVVMTFRDREQLNHAYEYMENADADPKAAKSHNAVKSYVLNPVFTCWQE